MDASDFGRYGTLYLLKRHEPDAIIAPYPIDEPEITLGRDSSCSIRLYYADVSAVHCRVVFNDEGKAFVVVLGTNGLLIDDCPVYPAPAGGAPTTVPLPNNSILEVHKKRFRFAYPPKHLRATLAAIPPTPVASPGTRRRALRMSMITSAQVFSPHPFADPKRNLQVLQSPLKAVFKPEPDSDEEEDEDEEEAAQEDMEEIVLVESDHPQVMESERDLVILDHVIVTEPPAAPPSPYRSSARAPQMPVPPQNWAPPRTPARRVPRASLHRAVLIRSAQRAALRNEMQREDEREAEEVESIMDEDAADVRMEDVEEDFEEEVKEEEEQQRRTPMSGWRKSLEAVKGGLGWAFRAASLEPETEETDDTPDEEPETVDGNEVRHDGHYAEYEEQHDNEEQDNMITDGVENTDNIYPNLEELQQPLLAGPSTPEPQRPLGRFMTPQASSTFNRASAQGRASIGGFAPSLASSVSGAPVGPRRVRLLEPWKVSDIVVPLADGNVKTEEDGDIKEERAVSIVPGPSTAGTPRRDRVSEAEKRAIRERRKSALKTPDTFFNGQAPGFRRAPAAPLPALFPSAPNTSTPLSPQKVPSAAAEADGAGAEDASVLLARMRQMVEGVRRRQSMEDAPRRASLSPRKRGGFSLLAREHGARGEPDAIMEEQEQDDGDGDTAEGAAVPVAVAPSQVRTPQMGDLRHLFRDPGPSATRQLKGVRDMFRPTRPLAEFADAALEGVGEMMSSPAGWRGKAVARDDEEEPAPVVPARSVKSRAVPAKRTPRSAATRKETPASGLAVVEEDEVAAPVGTQPPAARVVRRTRTRTAESDQEAAGTSIPRIARTRTPRADEEDEVPELPSRTKPPTRKKAGATSDASEDEAGAGSSKPLRRSTRAASTEPEVARKTPASVAASARRPRVAKTPVAPAPAPKPSTVRRDVRSKAAGAVEDDPLDSFAAEAPAPAATKVRRTARSRIPAAAAVKEEDTTPAAVPPSDDENAGPARAVRGRKPSATLKAPTSSGATRSGTRSRAGASSKKAVVEAPSAGTTTGEDEEDGVGDKENTPEPDDVPAAVTTTKSKAKPASASGSRAKPTRSATKPRGEAEVPAPVADAAVKGAQRVSRKRTTTAGKA